ncbi:hypothetical protein PTSG_02163 [Salpingoeca rosetta]|uniref:Nucleotide-diphospho-sugar transferase domain-containing protein n=1 Tax=Salpingoeca rosetta (strain ATCC 50818 / BSB-021) TaxID=946362 RepID=F2U1E0_SALR5|nr:uncharacterized protein PTSG_02163 [Salpingoeca rosetta]EGD81442.1 hypothetical protein PTSG_02163 [Salpingoeca rosetta]|eukprot:XP_004996646.1 hypothetical protein PTSG_02163 [Salpingoeca rosetta]
MVKADRAGKFTCKINSTHWAPEACDDGNSKDTGGDARWAESFGQQARDQGRWARGTKSDGDGAAASRQELDSASAGASASAHPHRHPHALAHVVVLCLDDEVLDWCVDRGLRCVPFNLNMTKRRYLWQARLYLIRDCLAQGYDVLMHDADVTWFSNPLPELITTVKTHSLDLLGQRGSYPKTVSNRWGAVLCGGLIYYRATSATRLVMDVAIGLLEYHSPDDQVLINMALALLAGTRMPSSVTSTGNKVLRRLGVRPAAPLRGRTMGVELTGAVAAREQKRCARKLCYDASTDTAILVARTQTPNEEGGEHAVRVGLLGNSPYARKCSANTPARGRPNSSGEHERQRLAHCLTHNKGTEMQVKVQELRGFHVWLVKESRDATCVKEAKEAVAATAAATAASAPMHRKLQQQQQQDELE